MPRTSQRVQRVLGMLFFNQYIVRVKGRNCEDGHAVFSQRIDEGCQNSGL